MVTIGSIHFHVHHQFAMLPPPISLKFFFVLSVLLSSTFGDSYKDYNLCWAGAPYSKWIASLELCHKEHNNAWSQSLQWQLNTINFTQIQNDTIVRMLTWYNYYQSPPCWVMLLCKLLLMPASTLFMPIVFRSEIVFQLLLLSLCLCLCLRPQLKAICHHLLPS